MTRKEALDALHQARVELHAVALQLKAWSQCGTLDGRILLPFGVTPESLLNQASELVAAQENLKPLAELL